MNNWTNVADNIINFAKSKVKDKDLQDTLNKIQNSWNLGLQ